MTDGAIAAIDVDRLSKTYPGGVEAVREITFRVAPGEVFGLLGPNGAGKSTTVGMLTTTILPSGGRARLAGFDVAADPLAARAVSSVVFQETVLDRSLSGRRNLEIHARLWRVGQIAAKERIDELSERLGLAELLERPVASYSGGQRRRLEIARALVSRPELLFMDEPTVGLDPRIRAELLDVIGGLRDRSETTILLTTHYLDEAEQLCDRIAIMHEGRVVALDAPQALLAELGEELVELRVQGDAANSLEVLRAHEIARHDAFVIGATVTVPLHGRNTAETIAAIDTTGVRTSAISTRKPSLDDVYLRLTGASLSTSE
jgi:ABC-2 type transport system ATP-binding protein